MNSLRDDLCAHCGLPLGHHPSRRAVHGEEHGFCCYGCVLAFQVSRGLHEESDAAWALIRLGVGAFLAMNIMLFSLLLYSGTLAVEEAHLRVWVHGILLALATPVVIILGGPFLIQAVRAARSGQVNADTLIVIGTGAAYGYSVWAISAGQEHVYFDTATMVLVLFTLGRYLEAAGRARAMRSLEPLLAPERQQAHVLAGEDEHDVPATQVAPGARVRVRPGERIPVDGRVVDGRSWVDESLLTGEARPVARVPGMAVLAGSVNGTGVLVVEVSSAGRGTRWAALCDAVRSALAQKGAIQRLADRVAAWFVFGVLALAALVALYWVGRVPGNQVLMTTLAVLVVACPCALGLATPLATSVAVGRALRQGFVIRSGAALETLAGVRAVAFDKTGTLTTANLQLCDCVPAEHATREELLAVAAALEQGSEHAIGRALRAAARAASVRAADVTDVRAVPGAGIEGCRGALPVAAGTASFMMGRGLPVPAALAARAEALAVQGCTVTFVAWAGRIRGLLGFSDEVRAEAATTVAELHRRGLRTVLLTGDGDAAAAAVAAAVGVQEYRARCAPEAKQAAIAELRAQWGPVAMVGDGLNDGPVLAAADVGVALGSASDLARDAADVVLPANGLQRLVPLFGLARATRRTIIINLLWAFGYNIVALGLAASGYLLPVVAAALMAGSSFLVVLNSLRLERIEARFTIQPTPQAPAATSTPTP